MSSLTHPSRNDVDICLAELEARELLRKKQAVLAYKRYEEQRQTFQVTGATLRRLFFWGALATFFVWWILS